MKYKIILQPDQMLCGVTCNSPYGYNSMIEKDGINLSCGEKQRFSIAKALVTNPDVLVLDESTANLDAATEEYVVEQLKRTCLK